MKHLRSQRGREFFRCSVHTFWCKKFRNFLKFMVCSHGQGGLSQCRHFADKKGINFSRFCAGVLYERPLMMKKNQMNRGYNRYTLSSLLFLLPYFVNASFGKDKCKLFIILVQ